MSALRNTGFVRVNMEILADLLHFPEGHRIVAVRQADDLSDAIDLRVEGPTLPAVDAGTIIPRVQLSITLTESDKLVRARTFDGKFS